MNITVPWPPFSTNHIWRTSRLGHTYLEPAAKDYKEMVTLRVKLAVQAGSRCPDGPLALSLWVYPPDRRRRDLDNMCKLVQDSIFAGLDADDSRVSELHVYRRDAVKAAYIAVCIEEEKKW